MSALLSITEPSGTISAGQSVTYSFSFAGPYPVNWTLTQWGTAKSLIATDNSLASVTLTVPSDPNSFGGTLTFYGPGESGSTYNLKPLDGFSQKMYPVMNTSDTYSTWSIKRYGNVKYVPNGSSTVFSLYVSAQGKNLALTTGSFPLTVYLTSQQIYPSTGAETTVQTQTFNTLGSYTSQTYTTPSVSAGTINRYKLYTTNASATSFNSDTGTTLSSCVPISNSQSPFIYVQPVNTVIPVTVMGTQYNATTIGLNYISSSNSPTITWYRNGTPVPGSWVVAIPNYAGFDTSITAQTSLCTNGDTFYCTISDPNGTVTSNTITLTINTPSVVDAVKVDVAASASNVISGNSVTLTSNTAANGPVSYQWYKNGSPIVGATGSTYTESVSTIDSGSVYSVSAKSGFASYLSPALPINVYNKSNSYPINSPITWSATASTSGNPGDAFNYSWAFDDGTVLVGQTVTKTKNSVGPLTATVTATDLSSMGSATATKTISLTDFSLLRWVSSGAKIIPAATIVSQDPIMPLMISGNLLVNIRDYYNPGSAVSFDTINMIRNENTSATSALTGGGPATGVMLTTGPNSGKILVISKGGTDYGFLDPVSLTMVKSPNVMPSAFFSNPTVQHICVPIDSARILVLGDNVSNGILNCLMYNQVSDSWQAMSTSGGPAGSALLDAALVNGKVWVISDNSLNTTCYTVSTNTWSAGPALSGIGGYAMGPTLKLAKRSDGFPFLVSYANPGTAYWWDGVSPTLIAGSNFPLASLNGGSLSSISTSICTSSPDGFILMAGGYGSGNTVALSNSVIYSSNSNSFIVLMGAFGVFIRRFEFLNGRFWACDQNGGVLYYTDPVW